MLDSSICPTFPLCGAPAQNLGTIPTFGPLQFTAFKLCSTNGAQGAMPQGAMPQGGAQVQAQTIGNTIPAVNCPVPTTQCTHIPGLCGVHGGAMPQGGAPAVLGATMWAGLCTSAAVYCGGM